MRWPEAASGGPARRYPLAQAAGPDRKAAGHGVGGAISASVKNASRIRRASDTTQFRDRNNERHRFSFVTQFPHRSLIAAPCWRSRPSAFRNDSRPPYARSRGHRRKRYDVNPGRRPCRTEERRSSRDRSSFAGPRLCRGGIRVLIRIPGAWRHQPRAARPDFKDATRDDRRNLRASAFLESSQRRSGEPAVARYSDDGFPFRKGLWPSSSRRTSCTTFVGKGLPGSLHELYGKAMSAQEVAQQLKLELSIRRIPFSIWPYYNFCLMLDIFRVQGTTSQRIFSTMKPPHPTMELPHPLRRAILIRSFRAWSIDRTVTRQRTSTICTRCIYVRSICQLNKKRMSRRRLYHIGTTCANLTACMQ
jgi:hypothetical protein